MPKPIAKMLYREHCLSMVIKLNNVKKLSVVKDSIIKKMIRAVPRLFTGSIFKKLYLPVFLIIFDLTTHEPPMIFLIIN